MAIQSNAEVALKYSEGIRESDIKKFQAITSATTQLTALTEELLTLTRTDQAVHLNISLTDLNPILEHLIQLYEPQAEAKQIDFKKQRSTPLVMDGDPIQIIRLFTNLIDNALRYTPNPGTLTVAGSREGEASKDSSKGFGLGLAIAQNIVQNHRGLLTVTSQLKVDSCFTVKIPLNADRRLW